MGDLILRAGDGSLDGSLDPKLGIIALRVGCWASTILDAITGTAPVVVQGLRESQPRTFARNTAGDVGGFNVDFVFEGHLDPSSADGEDFELEGSLSEDPIEAHPHFDLLLSTYQGTEDAGTGRAKWPATISTGGGSGTDFVLTGSLGDSSVFADAAANAAAGASETRNPMHGVESYRVPGLIWTRSWVSQHLPPGLVDDLGTLTSDVPGDEAPALTGRALWLCVRITGTYRGNIWKLRQSWQETGPYGIAPELYRRR